MGFAMGNVTIFRSEICVFCTEKQMSVCEFHLFCILLKFIIEIYAFFVYNVFIAVKFTPLKEWRAIAIPKGD